MISEVFRRIPAIRSSGFFTILIVVFFLSVSTAAYAEEIIYTGDGKGLQNSPVRFYEINAPSLFPGTTAVPLFSGNKITVNYNPQVAGTIAPQFVLGGLGKTENAGNNTVVLQNGQVIGHISGGFSNTGNVAGNSVVLLNGQVETILGGQSYYGDAADNKVDVSGGSACGDVYGGRSGEGGVINNIVTISGGEVDYCVYGGLSREGGVSGNTVTISGGLVHMDVIGGCSETGNVSGNTATISGGSVNGAVHGGISDGKDATDNTVIVSGGLVLLDVIGGYSKYLGNATGNTVTISGGSIAWGVGGGLSVGGSAVGNTVTISGRPKLEEASIWGGFTKSADADTFTGNTLNFKSSGLSAKGVSDFEYYNFDLPKGLADGAVMLSVTELVDLKGTTVAISLQDGSKLNKGDKVALIKSTKGISAVPKNKSCQVKHDGTLYEFSIYTDKNNLWAKVTKISSAAK